MNNKAEEVVDSAIQKYGYKIVESYFSEYKAWLIGGRTQHVGLLLKHRALFADLNPLPELPSRLYRGISTDCSHPRPGEKIFYSNKYDSYSSWTQNFEAATAFCGSSGGEVKTSSRPSRGCRGIIISIIPKRYVNKEIIPVIWPWKLDWCLAVSDALVNKKILGLRKYFVLGNEEEWVLYFKGTVPVVKVQFCLERNYNMDL